MTRQRRLPCLIAAAALVVAGCGSTPGPSVSIGASPASTPTEAATPAPTTSLPTTGGGTTPLPTATSEPTSTPTPQPTPTATATPVPLVPAGWTTPRTFTSPDPCGDLAAAVDSAGRYHIAAACGGSIRYYFAASQVGPWTWRVFSHASNRRELGPQVAFDGDRVYVAYTRIGPEGGCNAAQDFGVYFRSRILPNGAWSAATKIGAVADDLQSFQIANGTIEATVYGADGNIYFESRAGSVVHRTKIAHAVGATSLRVGADGRVRIAYQVEKGLRIATVTGSTLSSTSITGTTNRDWAPLLGLGASDAPFVVWTRALMPGCATEGPKPLDGTYFATRTSGVWASRRITKDAGEASLQVDAATGRAFVVVSGDKRLRLYVRSAGGTWTTSTLTTSRWPGSPAICIDPAHGTLVVAYVDTAAGSRQQMSNQIRVITSK